MKKLTQQKTPMLNPLFTKILHNLTYLKKARKSALDVANFLKSQKLIRQMAICKNTRVSNPWKGVFKSGYHSQFALCKQNVLNV